MSTAITKTGVTLTHLPLGAVWPKHGVFHGPAIATGSDGSEVEILKATAADGRTLAVAVANPLLGVKARLIEIMQAALPGASVERRFASADDVASFTLELAARGADSCAGTGVICQPWAGDRPTICAVYVDETHEFSAAWRNTPESLAAAR